MQLRRYCDVREFFDVCDTVLNSDHADPAFKLIALRRKLKKAAAVLSFAPLALYDALKQMLISEFGNKVTLVEAERLLRERRWLPQESMRQYVLEMQKLRRRLDTNRLTEAEFVDLIIDGLGDIFFMAA